MCHLITHFNRNILRVTSSHAKLVQLLGSTESVNDKKYQYVNAFVVLTIQCVILNFIHPSLNLASTKDH
jgi:hypothetical protein